MIDLKKTEEPALNDSQAVEKKNKSNKLANGSMKKLKKHSLK